MGCPEAPRHGRGHPEPTSAPRARSGQPELNQPDRTASSALPVHPCTQPELLPPHGHRHPLPTAGHHSVSPSRPLSPRGVVRLRRPPGPSVSARGRGDGRRGGEGALGDSGIATRGALAATTDPSEHPWGGIRQPRTPQGEVLFFTLSPAPSHEILELI